MFLAPGKLSFLVLIFAELNTPFFIVFMKLTFMN